MKQNGRNASTPATKNGRITVRRRRRAWFCFDCTAPATLILPLLLLGQINLCHAFATYLMSKSNCWTELSTDEVIMNNPVVAAADSDDPNMQIQVVDTSTDDANNRFLIVDHRIAVPSFPVTVPLRVVTSADSKTDPDYQWAMDVRDPDESAGERGLGSSTFVNGGCEGRNRVAGKSAKEFVKVVVTRPGASVVAAWATTHEAVRLTPAIEFVLVADNKNQMEAEMGNPETGPEDPVWLEEHNARGAVVDVEVDATSNEEGGNPESGPEDMKAEMENLKDYAAERKKDNPVDDPQKRIDELRRNSVDGLKAQIERHKKDRARASEKFSREEMEQRRQNNAAKKFVMRDRDSDTVLQGANRGNAKNKHLLQYEIGFDVHERLSVGSYIQGALMLIVGTAGIIQLCLCASRRGSKGRLDL